MSDKSRLFSYMRGWRCGAGFQAIPEDRDADFLTGWDRGRADAKAVSEEAEQIYGVKLLVLRPCTSSDDAG